MYRLFTKTHTQNRGTVNPSSHRTTLMRINRNINVVTKHIRETRHVVDNEHLLVKIIKSLAVNPLDDVYDYYRKVRSRYIDVARVHGISSSAVRGADSLNVFYGSGVREILFTVSENIDLLSLDKEWMNLEPIKVLRHASTGFSFEALDGKGFVSDVGVAVIQIDIVKLAMQFRQWYLMQTEKDVEYMESVRHFLWQYPLCNAIPSHCDIALLNRMNVLFDGGRGERFKNVWPVTVIDVTKDVDGYLLDRVVMVTRAPMLFDQIMENVLAISKPSMLEVLQLPVMSYTRPITWALVAARIPALHLLLKIDRETGSIRNTQELNILRRILRETKNDRSLPDFIRKEVDELILPFVKI